MSGNSFLIAAGGQGTRLGGIPKQFRELGGRPLWLWSLELCRKMFDEGLVNECIVVLPRSSIGEKLSSVGSMHPLPVKFAESGDNRRESVLNGLRSCSGNFVLIHDAARPFLTLKICHELLKSSKAGEGSIPCLDVVDALKCFDGSNKLRSADRTKYVLAQTPQCFPRIEMTRLLESSGNEIKDEAEVWLRNGRKLNIVKGDPVNFKITYERDWDMAKRILGINNDVRTGYGFDTHPMVPGRRMILAGMEITDSPLGLQGHSDADIVCHAIADALLGAAGLKDIGTLFPANSMKYKDAYSFDILAAVLNKVRSSGWDIRWIDVVLHAQKPLLADYIEPMTRKIESLFGYICSDSSHVNIKVKSGERVGPVGSLECMECHAVATLVRCSSVL